MSGEKDRIQVAVHDDVGFVRVEGRGSFKVSASVKEFGQSMLASGSSVMVLDMCACEGMDSTFMGVLAGLCVHYRKQPGGKLVVVNTSQKLQKLMSTLGLNRLLEVYPEGEAPAPFAEIVQQCGALEDLENQPQTELESAENMLEAHETLVQIDASNQPRFKDVVEYLRDDIQNHRDT